MAVTIENIRVICTAPEGINLLAVRVDTNVPGLYGWAAEPLPIDIWR